MAVKSVSKAALKSSSAIKRDAGCDFDWRAANVHWMIDMIYVQYTLCRAHRVGSGNRSGGRRQFINMKARGARRARGLRTAPMTRLARTRQPALLTDLLRRVAHVCFHVLYVLYLIFNGKVDITKFQMMMSKFVYFQNDKIYFYSTV